MPIAKLQQGPFAIFFPCPKLKRSRQQEVTCLRAASCLKHLDRSSRQRTGCVAVLGEGGVVSLAPSYQEALLYLPVLSTSQKAKGEGREHGQAGALLTVPAVWKRGPAAPQDDAPASCLPSLSSPELPITCLLVALCLSPLQPITLSPSPSPHHAHCTVPITSPPHCPHGMPIRLPQHYPSLPHPPLCKWLQRAFNHPC